MPLCDTFLVIEKEVAFWYILRYNEPCSRVQMGRHVMLAFFLRSDRSFPVSGDCDSTGCDKYFCTQKTTQTQGA